MKSNTKLIILTVTYIVLSNNSWLPIFLYINENDYQTFLRTNLFNGNHIFHMLILVTLKKAEIVLVQNWDGAHPHFWILKKLLFFMGFQF